MFKARLDEALNNTAEWKASLPMAVRLKLDGPLAPFQANLFYDSVICMTPMNHAKL